MKISNGLLHTGAEIIPVSKIQSCGIVFRKTKWKYDSKSDVLLYTYWPLIGVVLIGVVLPYGPLSLFGVHLDFWHHWSFFGRLFASAILGFLVCIPWLQVYEALAPKIDEYAVKVSLDSGATQLFWTPNKKFAEKVAEVLSRAMGASTTQANVTINVDKQEIINNSTTTLHNHGTFNVEITNTVGMSKEDMEFMMGAFQQGMRELAAEIEANGNQQMQAALKDMQAAVNSNAPEPGAIKRAYERLKTVSDGFGVYDNVVKVGGLVAQAAMIFTN